MSKIVLVAEGSANLHFLSTIRRIIDVGLDDLKLKVEGGRPFWESILFKNDHEEQATKLRALTEAAERLGIRLRVFELEPEEAFDDCDKKQCEIDTNTLDNILSEAERRRQ
jgi:hypothetical protein